MPWKILIKSVSFIRCQFVNLLRIEFIASQSLFEKRYIFLFSSAIKFKVENIIWRYQYESTKISKDWGYLLQEVAILQIFWWLVKCKQIWRKSFCKRIVPPCRGSNPHPSDLGVSALLTELLELCYTSEQNHMNWFKIYAASKKWPQQPLPYICWRSICVLFTIGTICLYL